MSICSVSGTTANVTYIISNTCILDTFFEYIPSDQTVDRDSGELHSVVPGYYAEEFGECMEESWAIRASAYTRVMIDRLLSLHYILYTPNV